MVIIYECSCSGLHIHQFLFNIYYFLNVPFTEAYLLQLRIIFIWGCCVAIFPIPKHYLVCSMHINVYFHSSTVSLLVLRVMQVQMMNSFQLQILNSGLPPRRLPQPVLISTPSPNFQHSQCQNQLILNHLKSCPVYLNLNLSVPTTTRVNS